MAEENNGEIKMKKWIVIVFIPVIVTLLGFTLNSVIILTSTKDRVKVHEKIIDLHTDEIQDLQSNKLDKSDYQADNDRLFETLDRIENKLDGYIKDNN